MPGILAKKIGMTQIYTQEGSWVPVTVVEAGPCTVTQKKLEQKEGYAAVQLGFQSVKKISKPKEGHFKKRNVSPNKVLKEIKTQHADSYNVGDSITVSAFQIGDLVDVQGVSKGKGFQGVMKRHNFKGGRATHGCSVSHRSPGSIGQRTWPGKVFKGKKMAGQLGNEQVTVKNLKVVGVEQEKNILLIKGAVPGANNSVIVILPVSQEVEKRYLANSPKKEAKQEVSA